jgi:hypothetical protein
MMVKHSLLKCDIVYCRRNLSELLQISKEIKVLYFPEMLINL